MTLRKLAFAQQPVAQCVGSVGLMIGTVVLLFGLVGAAVAGILAWFAFRPNRSRIDPSFDIETWSVAANGQHNAYADLILWRGAFILVHATSPSHLGSTRSRILIKRSVDGRQWETLATLRLPNLDIRDPKVVVIEDRLHLYALPNDSLYATPKSTVLAVSDDGVDWSEFEPLKPEGWLFWRPKTFDGVTWYVAAYWHKHGQSILLRSTDGRSWDRVSEIYQGEANDETAIEFLADGRLLATARLEGRADSPWGHPDAGTLVAVAEPPFEQWRHHKSRVTRLDGPALFRLGDRLFAFARYQPGPFGRLTGLGGAFSRKRTSLFRVAPSGLEWLTDLPSAGDTSYAGVVVHDGHLYVNYYTSRIDRDYPWVLGMFLSTEIRMARIPVDRLESP